MPGKKIIIIGAGLAGLATGIYAQMNGYRARILEHGRQPGGVSATWKRGGYKFDGGIHYYMGYRPGQPVHELYRELGVYQADQYREMDIYSRFINPENGSCIDVTQDLDRFAEELKGLSPADGGLVNDLIAGAKVFGGADFLAFMEKPPDLQGTWDLMKMMIRMAGTLKYYRGRYNQPIHTVTRQMQNRWLREIWDHLFLPDVPVWFVLVILGMLHAKNMALRLDGSAGFARALEKRFFDLGGDISYGATVKEIVVENNRAVGVRLADDEMRKADAVISAADGYQTIFELLSGKYIDPSIQKRYSEWPLFKPVVMVNFGVKRDFIGDPWMVAIKADPPIKAGYIVGSWLPVRIFNYSPAFAPEGKTVIQVMVESTWEPWRLLRDDMEAYQSEKQAFEAQVLNSLEKMWPGVSGQIEVSDVSTPYTMWRYTLNRQGAYEGFAVTDKTITARVFRMLPNLKAFYMAGQWTSPGGGVVPSLMTGRHAVMLMCKQDGKKFQRTN